MTAPLIIYHKNCNDGFAAAWVAWKFFAGEAEFHPTNYSGPSSEIPEARDRNIFILDFSYSRADLMTLASRNKSVFVLDHHKTAAMDLALLPGCPSIGPYLDHKDKGFNFPLCADFDMGRSGAGIAWDYFFPGIERPHLINYVEDRDLWRFNDPDTRAIHSTLNSYDYDFKVWNQLYRDMQVPRALLELIGEGQTLDRMHLKRCREIIEQGRRIATIGGYYVPVCNAPYAFASDIGNLMCSDAGANGKAPPFAATYFEHAGGRTFSLRSTPAGIDASEVAKRFGGGGHRNACGFTLKAEPDGGLTWPA